MTTETITRTPLDNGKFQYESSVRGVVLAASKVLYTHASIFAPMNEQDGPILFHKSEAAAMKAKGYPQYGWVKAGVVAIDDAAGNPVVETSELAGWSIRRYRNGMWDAAEVDGNGLTVGFASFAAARAEVLRITGAESALRKMADSAAARAVEHRAAGREVEAEFCTGMQAGFLASIDVVRTARGV